MKQAKLLFLLRNDLASTSQRIIIEISEEDHEYCIGHGDDDREYVLKQNERYRVLEDPRGIRVFGRGYLSLSAVQILQRCCSGCSISYRMAERTGKTIRTDPL